MSCVQGRAVSPSALPLPQEFWCDQRDDSSLPGPGTGLQDLSVWVPGILLILIIFCFITSVTLEKTFPWCSIPASRSGTPAHRYGPVGLFWETTSCDSQGEVNMFCACLNGPGVNVSIFVKPAEWEALQWENLWSPCVTQFHGQEQDQGSFQGSFLDKRFLPNPST